MRAHLSLLAAAALTLGASAALGCPGRGKDKAAEGEGVKTTVAYVEVEQLDQWLASKQVTVVDANKPETWAAGHIPGAIHAKHDSLTAAELPADKAAKLAFYCFNEQCGASHKAAEKAIEMGYTQVFVLKAGIEGWKKAGKAVEAAQQAKPEAAPKGQG